MPARLSGSSWWQIIFNSSPRPYDPGFVFLGSSLNTHDAQMLIVTVSVILLISHCWSSGWSLIYCQRLLLAASSGLGTRVTTAPAGKSFKQTRSILIQIDPILQKICIIVENQTSGPGLVSGPKYCGEQTTQVDQKYIIIIIIVIIIIIFIIVIIVRSKPLKRACHHQIRPTCWYFTPFPWYYVPCNSAFKENISGSQRLGAPSPALLQHVFYDCFKFKLFGWWTIGKWRQSRWKLDRVNALTTGMAGTHWNKTLGRPRTCTRFVFTCTRWTQFWKSNHGH